MGAAGDSFTGSGTGTTGEVSASLIGVDFRTTGEGFDPGTLGEVGAELMRLVAVCGFESDW